jgi:hypothetical protein
MNIKQAASAGSVSLLTPTYWRDLKLCELLCESVDRCVTSFGKHYLIVADRELPLFRHFNGSNREVLPASEFLPAWLRPLPRALRRKNRSYWWSFRASPVSGWHVQQLLKFAAASVLPSERFCILDSDVVFFRPFDAAALRRPNPAPLFYAPAAVAADAPLHGRWVMTSHALLGLEPPTFPADDYIGHIICWDRRTVRAILERIEQVNGMEWAQALCRTRDFSEYMLYGYFLRHHPGHMAAHRAKTRLQCMSYWGEATLDVASISALIESADTNHVAFSAASISGTPVEFIRCALENITVDVGYSRRPELRR